MSRKTGIEWTDATWNPIRGCSRVSEGCRNCYAETVANRFCGPGKPYEGVVQIGSDGKGIGKWNGQIKFVEKHLADPLRWKHPQRIFVNSMSDLFHENVTDEMLDKIHGIMWACEYLGKACWPGHTFQILTKRAGRLPVYYGRDRRELWARHAVHYAGGHNPDLLWEQIALADHVHPRIHLGVSVENQAAADDRIMHLLATPAAKRFISAEPLLGPIDLTEIKLSCPAYDLVANAVDQAGRQYLDWVIVGGESGPGARPMHPDWARNLRDQCVAAGVPFFFKQWGEWLPAMTDGIGHLNASDEPVRVGKHAAGRLLDLREWNEMPA